MPLSRKTPTNHEPARRLPLSCNRALVLDVLHFAQQVPLFPVEKAFSLGELAEARTRAEPSISWALLFLKAYALVCRDHPPLRQAFMPWPRAHLLEHPCSVGTLAISRPWRGEERLCWGRFDQPEGRPLTELAWRLRRYQVQPVEEVFREQLRLSRLPAPLRRLILAWNLNFAGPKRAKRLGTFSLSTLAGQGALNRGHPTMLTSSLTYGPLDEEGRLLVTLLCDHRVLDGVQAARALRDLEQVLKRDVAIELNGLAAAGKRAA